MKERGPYYKENEEEVEEEEEAHIVDSGRKYQKPFLGSVRSVNNEVVNNGNPGAYICLCVCRLYI